MRGSRGLALVLVVGVLGILAVLGSAFAVLSRLERRAASQRVHATRARLLARSGIEDALARLSAGQDPGVGTSRYGGEDWDLSGIFEPGEQAEEVHQPGRLNIHDCPVAQAMRPSFSQRTGLEATKVNVEGRFRGCSGSLGGEGSHWALKVEDESGKIHLNGGLLDTGDRDGDGVEDHRDRIVSPTGGYNAPDPIVLRRSAEVRGWNSELTRILNVLGFELGIPGLGETLLAARPPGGYATLDEVQKAATSTTDLRPYLTLSAWIDRKVIRPRAWDMSLDANTSVNVRPIPLLEEGGRPPVNLNSASRPVLVALLEGLHAQMNGFAVWSNEAEIRDAASPDPLLWVVPCPIPPPPVSTIRAGRIADAMLAQRPWRDWNAFGAFCDGLAVSGIIDWRVATSTLPVLVGERLAVADLLKANFDPNSRLMRFNPDQLMHGWTDKLGLDLHSTEGSLGPGTRYGISVVGRVLGPDGGLRAQRTLSADCEIFRILRHTTQADFVGGRVLSADTAEEPRYLSLSTDPVLPSAGATAGAAWWGGAPPGVGVATLTHPEPPTALPSLASVIDGYVGLSTLDHAPRAGIRFLHHFDDSMDAEVECGGDPVVQPDVFNPDVASSSFRVPGASYPSNPFRPDGLRNVLCFDPVGNFPVTGGAGDRGVVSYWLKSPAQWGVSNAWQEHLRVSREAGVAPAIHTQVFVLGAKWLSSPPANVWGMVVESRLEPYSEATVSYPGANNSNFWNYDVSRERHYYDKAVVRPPGRRWHLATACFDTEKPSLADQAWYSVEGVDNGTGDSNKGWTPGSGNWYGTGAYTTALNPSLSQKLIVPGSRFAVQGSADVLSGRSWTMDELAVYDLDLAGAQGLAATRRLDGRYYKQDDARFLSPTLAPEEGVRLQSARWTAYLPREDRLEINNAWGLVNRIQDPKLQGSDLVVDLMGWNPVPGAWEVVKRIQPGGSIGMSLPRFKYQVTFRPKVDPLNDPVLETPLLDDITFYYQGRGGPSIWGWGSPET